MRRIGFGGVFYTLWDITSQMQYSTDSNGNHWPSYVKTKCQYIKNVSKDLAAALAAYPDLEVDEDLRGMRRSFSYFDKQEDLTPNLLKFGKYKGKFVEDVVKIDLNYVLWLRCEAVNALRVIIESLPEVIAHEKAKQEAHDDACKDIKRIEADGEYEVTFFKNCDERGFAGGTIGEGNIVNVYFKDCVMMSYNGYEYGLPKVNGKGKRIKGKTLKVRLEAFTQEANPKMLQWYDLDERVDMICDKRVLEAWNSDREQVMTATQFMKGAIL